MLKREELHRPMWILTGMLLLLLVLGSFLDLPLASFLYAEKTTVFGRLFSALGELPAFLLFIMSGITWLIRRGRSSRFLEWFSILGGLALMGAGVLLTYLALREDLPSLTFVDAAIFTLVVLAAGVVFGLLLTRNSSRADCYRFVFTVLFAAAFSMLIVNLVKFPWSRPRIRLILSDDQVRFVPWWKPQGFAQSLFDDAYRSFPSGHTAMAACSILWTMFPVMHPRMEGTGRFWLALSCVWTALVALARMSMGAHFLSDIAVSWAFILMMYLLSVLAFWRDGPIFRWLYKVLT